MAHTHCPNCNCLLRVPESPARVRVRCPQCTRVFVTVPREKTHPPGPAHKKPVAVPTEAPKAEPAGGADEHDTHRCAIGLMAQTQFGKTLDVDGVELPLAGDLAGFLDLADYRHACCAIIDIGDFARFHSAVLEHMRDRFGPASDQALAVNYARLVCFACGTEYRQARLLELRKGRHTQDGGGSAGAGACHECGKCESLYVYDNLAAGNVTAADIDALRAYWRHRARLWWAQRGSKPEPCFACGEAVLPGHGFSRDDRLYCPRCVAREDDLAHLRSNPHYFGGGELTRARAFNARQERRQET